MFTESRGETRKAHQNMHKNIWIPKKIAIKIMDKTDIKICWIIIKRKDRDKFINYRKLYINMQ